MMLILTHKFSESKNKIATRIINFQACIDITYDDIIFKHPFGYYARWHLKGEIINEAYRLFGQTKETLIKDLKQML